MPWRVDVRRHEVAFGTRNRSPQPMSRFQVSAVRPDAGELLIRATEDVIRWGRTRDVAVAAGTATAVSSQFNHAVCVRLRQMLATRES
jgi:hypothetical protein